VREILAYKANPRGELHYRAPTNTYWRAGPFVERIHGAEVIMLPDVGHVPIYDDPEQVVAHILSVTASVDAVREVAK
jgi:pimeloyl-ACP methyl ester carboxylesterase